MCRLKITLPLCTWYFFFFLSLLFIRCTQFNWTLLPDRYWHLSFPNRFITIDRIFDLSLITNDWKKKKRKKSERRITWKKFSRVVTRENGWVTRGIQKPLSPKKNFWMLCYDDRWKKRLASATSFKARRTRRVTEGFLLRSVYTRSNRSIDTDLCFSNVRGNGGGGGKRVNLSTRVTRVPLYRQFIEPSGELSFSFFLFFFLFATDMAHALFRRLINVRVSKLITCYLQQIRCRPMRSKPPSYSSTPEPSFFVEVVCVTKLYKVYRDNEKNFKPGIYMCAFLLCPLARGKEREKERNGEEGRVGR